MPILPIAVWERSPYWVPELQRQLERLGVRVATCRNEADVAARTAEGARQLVIALPPGERFSLPEIQQWISNGVRVHVVLNPVDEPYRWFLHELGAASVFNFDEARAFLIRTVSGLEYSGEHSS